MLAAVFFLQLSLLYAHGLDLALVLVFCRLDGSCFFCFDLLARLLHSGQLLACRSRLQGLEVLYVLGTLGG